MQTLSHPESEPQPRPENASDLGVARYIDNVGLPWFKFRRANLRDPRIVRLSPPAKVLWLALFDGCMTRTVVDDDDRAWPVHEANRTLWLDLVELAQRANLEGEDLRDAVAELYKARLVGFGELLEGALQPAAQFGDATQDLTAVVVCLEMWSLYEEGTGRERERVNQRQRICRDRKDRGCHTELDLRKNSRKLALPFGSNDETTGSYPQPRPEPQDRSGSALEEVAPAPLEDSETPAENDSGPRSQRVDIPQPDKQAAALWNALCDARRRHGLVPMVGSGRHRAKAIEVWTDMLAARVSVAELGQQIEARCLEAVTETVDFANSNGWAHPGAAEISARLAYQRRESMTQEREKVAMVREAVSPPPLPSPEPEPEPDRGPSLYELPDSSERIAAMMANVEAFA